MSHTDDEIVKFTGDEGRNRATSPSLNAPHSFREALVAVLDAGRAQDA